MHNYFIYFFCLEITKVTKRIITHIIHFQGAYSKEENDDMKCNTRCKSLLEVVIHNYIYKNVLNIKQGGMYHQCDNIYRILHMCS